MGAGIKTGAAPIEISEAPVPGRLLALGQSHDGFITGVAVQGTTAGMVKMHLDRRLALGLAVSLALSGSLHCGGRVVWRQGSSHGIAFGTGGKALADVLAHKRSPRPTASLP